MQAAGGREAIRATARGFGWDRLRPGQEEAVRALLAGEDVLAVMPTGHGKSAIYQLAATLLEGVTVVVSPLIALQHDQVEQLEGIGAEQAVAVNSAQRSAETREAWEDLAEGEAESVFLAPRAACRSSTGVRCSRTGPAGRSRGAGCRSAPGRWPAAP